MMRGLVGMLSPNVVLDPFAGSGSILVAAVESGASPIGFDILPDYYHIANQRLENTRQKLKLQGVPG